MSRPNTEWSTPGHWRGMANRHQSRFFRGYWLHAGSNNRSAESDFREFCDPPERTPWAVSTAAIDGSWPEDVARGVSGSQSEAMEAAEAAALALAERTGP